MELEKIKDIFPGQMKTLNSNELENQSFGTHQDFSAEIENLRAQIQSSLDMKFDEIQTEICLHKEEQNKKLQCF